jgi:hypothetical protein
VRIPPVVLHYIPIHPRWFDALFWEEVAEEERRLQRYAEKQRQARAMSKQEAGNE